MCLRAFNYSIGQALVIPSMIVRNADSLIKFRLFDVTNLNVGHFLVLSSGQSAISSVCSLLGTDNLVTCHAAVLKVTECRLPAWSERPHPACCKNCGPYILIVQCIASGLQTFVKHAAKLTRTTWYISGPRVYRTLTRLNQAVDVHSLSKSLQVMPCKSRLVYVDAFHF